MLIQPSQKELKIGQNNPENRRSLNYARGLLLKTELVAIFFDQSPSRFNSRDETALSVRLESLYLMGEMKPEDFDRSAEKTNKANEEWNRLFANLEFSDTEDDDTECELEIPKPLVDSSLRTSSSIIDEKSRHSVSGTTRLAGSLHTSASNLDQSKLDDSVEGVKASQ